MGAVEVDGCWSEGDGVWDAGREEMGGLECEEVGWAEVEGAEVECGTERRGVHRRQ